ncbi:hypothetical protein [Bacillus sp. 1P06AnD]|uniref:hypothetical protein n=1 Tax=Bacillus sp. 1P06AnD TaxID=3132208 RepID=UPI0039A1A62F
MSISLIISVFLGIVYGTFRTIQLSDSPKKKKRHPYLESIIITLVAYLIVSTLLPTK